MEIKRTPTFDLAYRFVTETWRNVFLTGKAGTGKTTFLKYLRETTAKKMIVVAPTGVAAVNAGGVTIHSFFQLPFGPFVPAPSKDAAAITGHSLLSRIRLNREKIGLMRSMELLVIDEASMVPCHTVDAIDTLLRSVRRRPDQAFGGVQVLFIGDLHQLQPVVRNEEWEILRPFYPGIFFFDSHVLQQQPPVIIELKEIFRQSDEAFIEVLNEIRTGKLSAQGLALLNTRLKPGFEPQQEEGYVTLTTHNAQADEINRRRLAQLLTKPRTFRAEIEGEFPESMFPAETTLELKPGAQVMFLKNDGESRRFFNGKIGTVTGFADNKVLVQCEGDADEIEVSPTSWDNLTFTLDPDSHEILEEVAGTFRQFPLRLAWAITIHKSQGLTFSKLVIDAQNAFAKGQVYVALSRCKTLDGLVLTSPLSQRFLGAHPHLEAWHETHGDESSLEQRLAAERRAFVLEELGELFGLRNLSIKLAELVQALQENVMDLQPGWEEGIAALRHPLNALESVSDKFKSQLAALSERAADPEMDAALQKRIVEGAQYFHQTLNNWRSQFHKVPVHSKVKRTAKVIQTLIDELNFILHESLFRLQFAKGGFSLSVYLEQGKIPQGDIAKGKPVLMMKAPRGAKKMESLSSDENPSLKRPVPTRKIDVENARAAASESQVAELYRRLTALRKVIAADKGVEAYRVFSNAALQGISEAMPADEAALLNVKGMGARKVEEFGSEVLAVVHTFCAENGIVPSRMLPPSPTAKPRKKRESLNESIEQSLALLRQGSSIEEIAASRGLTTGTIESHLADAIAAGKLNLLEVMDPSEIELIQNALPPVGESVSLSTVREKLPPEVSYGKMRMVLASRGK